MNVSEANAITKMAHDAGENSGSKGFHRDWDLASELEALGPKLNLSAENIAILNEAANALRLNVIGMKLMLTVSELGEALESLRDTGIMYGPYNVPHLAGDGNFGEELADAVIRIGDLAHITGVTLGEEVHQKMKKNSTRPKMHGKKA